MGDTGPASVTIDNKVVSCDSDNIADPGSNTFIAVVSSLSVNMENLRVQCQ